MTACCESRVVSQFQFCVPGVHCLCKQACARTDTHTHTHTHTELNSTDFPGGLVVKNPPSNAGDVGSTPGWRTNALHAMGQLSPGAASTEPRALGSMCGSKKSRSASTESQCRQRHQQNSTGLCCPRPTPLPVSAR